MTQYAKKEQLITFEANEKLFAEFINWKECLTNKEFVGYVSDHTDRDGTFLYYKPLRETEAIKVYRELVESFKHRIQQLESDNNKKYYELQELQKGKEKKKRKWF